MRVKFEDGSWKLTDLQKEVVEAFIRHPDGLTDEELSDLPVFLEEAPSTVRTRRSELEQAGILYWAGDRANSRGKLVRVHALMPDWIQ